MTLCEASGAPLRRAQQIKGLRARRHRLGDDPAGPVVRIDGVNGAAGLARYTARTPDLVLLDVLMPELDGLEVCRRIRKLAQTPIIFLTSRADEVDRINGLELGADDFVAKPFSTRELVARIRAVGRRAGKPGEAVEVLRIGALSIDPARFSVSWNGTTSQALTKTEFQLLHSLAVAAGRVLSRDRLIDLLRGDDVAITERTIDTFVKRVRKKLRDLDPAFDEIETVFGVGYRYRG